MTQSERLALLGRFRFRHLTPDQEDAIRRTGGTLSRARAADLASAYGVSARTIYRVLARGPIEARVDVRVGDYLAVFEIGDEGPVQLTGWVAA